MKHECKIDQYQTSAKHICEPCARFLCTVPVCLHCLHSLIKTSSCLSVVSVAPCCEVVYVAPVGASTIAGVSDRLPTPHHCDHWLSALRTGPQSLPTDLIWLHCLVATTASSLCWLTAVEEEKIGHVLNVLIIWLIWVYNTQLPDPLAWALFNISENHRWGRLEEDENDKLSNNNSAAIWKYYILKLFWQYHRLLKVAAIFIVYVRDRQVNSTYRNISNIRRTLVSNEIVDHSDVVGASPVGAAPTTSSFST